MQFNSPINKVQILVLLRKKHNKGMSIVNGYTVFLLYVVSTDYTMKNSRQDFLNMLYLPNLLGPAINYLIYIRDIGIRDSDSRPIYIYLQSS